MVYYFQKILQLTPLLRLLEAMRICNMAAILSKLNLNVNIQYCLREFDVSAGCMEIMPITYACKMASVIISTSLYLEQQSITPFGCGVRCDSSTTVHQVA